MNIYSLSMTIFTTNQINEIASCLKSGKAVILPTDTVWGVASISEDLVYEVKKRPREKKVIKFVSSVDEVGLPSFLANIIKEHWPGGLTIIWKGISYRMPDCPYIIEIVKQTGPLYQSSANISGGIPIKSALEAQKEFKDSLDKVAIVDNNPAQKLSNKPSTIINLDSLVAVRNGQINGQEIINKIKERKP